MYKFTKTQIKNAIESSNGTMTSVANKLKVKSPITAEKFVKKHPDLLELYHSIQDNMIDEAENVLMNNLKSDNEFIRARTCEFILKHMPKTRWKEDTGTQEDVQLELVKLLDRMMDSTSSNK